MTLDLTQVTEVLKKYYPSQQWRCAEPVDTDPCILDEYGNIVSGIQWYEENTVGKPTMEDLEERWLQIEATGEYKKQWDLPRDEGGGGVYYGTLSQYAQRLLTLSDWAALPDVGLENQAEWDAYRATLRDIRSNPSADKTIPSIPQVKYK
jgi:hypothetical protein